MTNLNYYELRSRAVAITYHYVRPPVDSLPYFKFLHIDDFRKQLIWLKNNFSFPSVDQFLDTCHSLKRWMGVLLTFDDGLSEHHDYVLPILKELGLWGIFYVPTGPMNTRIMLDVHRVHLLLGRLGGENALKLLGDIIEDYMITVSKEKHATFLKETYKLQDSTPASINFKQTLNYFIGEEHRSEVLTNMIEQTFGTAFPSECENFYLNSGQLLELDKQGMIIGSHGVNHKLMSQLARDKQWNEISESSDYLYEVTGKKVITYCHPYGGLNSFDSTTETLLKAYGIRCSFTVHPGDVTDNQLTATPFALPRFDCNMFPYGAPFASPQFELQKET